MNYKTHQNVGLGMVGEFETPMEEHDFSACKEKMQADGIHSYRKTDKKWQFWAVPGYAIKKCNYGWC
jgi:hypothetical protein